MPHKIPLHISRQIIGKQLFSTIFRLETRFLIRPDYHSALQRARSYLLCDCSGLITSYKNLFTESISSIPQKHYVAKLVLPKYPLWSDQYKLRTQLIGCIPPQSSLSVVIYANHTASNIFSAFILEKYEV